ncbi:MAG: DUF1284 domain-containing protein [Rhodovulum sulfidophilum]|uniref:DUF1284 domain-containing protein n=1 Tax=Rhodovulum sulfidophilum TaxID=35806 RepID=A0A2W5Q3T3_RHOSU|nr:MAG: DUF1284 domain-containing protein [Rhodovulum sulfidophilum]
MTIRLRPHHLLCVLTYVGKGYTPAFVANYDRIAKRIAAGEPILIVAGPDDICAPLLGPDGPDQIHCHDEGVAARDRRAARAVGALLGLAVAPGTHLHPDAALIAKLRAGFAVGMIRSACDGCSWAALCDMISEDGYSGTRIPARAPANRPA